MVPLRQRMIEDTRVRNFSANTQRLYVDRVAKFAPYLGKSPELIGLEHIRAYQVYLIQCFGTPGMSDLGTGAILPAALFH